jgi:uncharacterized protein (TIGR02246 family)
MKPVNVLLILCTLAAAFGQADSKSADPKSDDAMIRQRLRSYAEARNRRDAHAEALCYTEDGDFRFANSTSRGRAEIEKTLAVSDTTYRFSLDVDSVRFLDSKVALAEAKIVAGPPQHRLDMLGTYVMVKRNGAWLIGAARISRSEPPQ